MWHCKALQSSSLPIGLYLSHSLRSSTLKNCAKKESVPAPGSLLSCKHLEPTAAAATSAAEAAKTLRSMADAIEKDTNAVSTAVQALSVQFMMDRLPPHPDTLPPQGPSPTINSSIFCRSKDAAILVNEIARDISQSNAMAGGMVGGYPPLGSGDGDEDDDEGMAGMDIEDSDSESDHEPPAYILATSHQNDRRSHMMSSRKFMQSPPEFADLDSDGEDGDDDDVPDLVPVSEDKTGKNGAEGAEKEGDEEDEEEDEDKGPALLSEIGFAMASQARGMNWVALNLSHAVCTAQILECVDGKTMKVSDLDLEDDEEREDLVKVLYELGVIGTVAEEEKNGKNGSVKDKEPKQESKSKKRKEKGEKAAGDEDADDQAKSSRKRNKAQA